METSGNRWVRIPAKRRPGESRMRRGIVLAAGALTGSAAGNRFTAVSGDSDARARGSLFRRDPDGTVLTVVPGLYFANGVTSIKNP